MPITNKSSAVIELLVHYFSWISIFSFSVVCFVCAQELTNRELPDTIKIKPPINRSLLLGFDSIGLLSPSIRKSSINSTWYAHQSLINLPSSLSPQFQQQIDVISPWKQELAEDSKLRTVKWLLQSVQAGATAYILYEHIRKYGLK